MSKLFKLEREKGSLLMNKFVITTLLLCTGLAVAGCEKTYSVKEFKTNQKLYEEWAKKCESDDSPLKSSQKL